MKKNVKKNNAKTNIKKSTKEGKKLTKKEKERNRKIVYGILIAICIVIIICAAVLIGIFFSDTFALSTEDLLISATNTMVYDSEGNVIQEISGQENRKTISMSEMSTYLPKAFVAIEDERFYKHQGIDIKRTTAATVSYVFGGGSSSFGGSTITQQLVKNITNEKDSSGFAGITRKVREMSRAYQIEKMISKDQILELYLNLIPMGSSGGDICGVEIASIYYFNKSASDLTLEECAFLAGINNSPNRYNPFRGDDKSELIKTRTKTVLSKMAELNYISKEECEQAKVKVDEGLKFSEGEIPSSTVTSYFVAAAIDQVVNQLVEEKGMSKEYAKNRVYGGGYKIYTTQITSIQDNAYNEYKNDKYTRKSAKTPDSHSQAAIVIIDHTTGKVVACMGGLGSDTDAIGINRIYSLRQPGSSIKPLAVYGCGIEKHIITAATVYDNSPTTFGGSYSPSSTTAKAGLCTIRDAIEVSSNVVACKIMSEIGPANSIEFLRQFGITSLVLSSEDSKYNDESLSTALGGVTHGISPLEMAAAYSAIANDGVYISPTFYTKVEDAHGQTVIESTQTTRRVMSEQSAYVTQSILTAPVIGGSGTARNCSISGMSVGAKTGTTDKNYDRWLCGFTPYYTAASWYGYDINEVVNYGGNPAAILWDAVMTKVHSKLKSKYFDRPSGIVNATICKDSGCLATDSCTNTTSEVFISGTVPTACEGHIKSKICKATGKLANEYCTDTEETVTLVKPIKEQNGKWTTREGDKYTIVTEICDVHKAPPVEETPVITNPPAEQVDTDIIIPNVVGKTESEAKSILQKLGIVIKEVKEVETEDQTKVGKIESQSISADTVVAENAKITLYVYKLKKVVTNPNVNNPTEPVEEETEETEQTENSNP